MKLTRSLFKGSPKSRDGKRAWKIFIVALAACITLGSAALMTLAADMYIYPSKGQNQKQQNKDQYACHQWAVKQTGVDPVQLAEKMSQPETYQKRGGAIKGAAGGAAVGAVGGAIGGDAGKGAAIGAGAGGLLGHMRARRSMKEQQEAYNQAHSEMNKQLQQYDKAYTTCLRGKGYTVSE